VQNATQILPGDNINVAALFSSTKYDAAADEFKLESSSTSTALDDLEVCRATGEHIAEADEDINAALFKSRLLSYGKLEDFSAFDTLLSAIFRSLSSLLSLLLTAAVTIIIGVLQFINQLEKKFKIYYLKQQSNNKPDGNDIHDETLRIKP